MAQMSHQNSWALTLLRIAFGRTGHFIAIARLAQRTIRAAIVRTLSVTARPHALRRLRVHDFFKLLFGKCRLNFRQRLESQHGHFGFEFCDFQSFGLNDGIFEIVRERRSHQSFARIPDFFLQAAHLFTLRFHRLPHGIALIFGEHLFHHGQALALATTESCLAAGLKTLALLRALHPATFASRRVWAIRIGLSLGERAGDKDQGDGEAGAKN